MTLTKDHIGGLFFLSLSVIYGHYAGDIRLLPGEEYEPFHAQTVPYALAYLCGGLSLMLIVTASRQAKDKLSLRGYDFRLVALLLALVVIFALSLQWFGFLISTVIFLLAGYRLLGEKRPKMLFLASVPFAVGLWFILTQLLDIYLAPGLLINTLFGG